MQPQIFIYLEYFSNELLIPVLLQMPLLFSFHVLQLGFVHSLVIHHRVHRHRRDPISLIPDSPEPCEVLVGRNVAAVIVVDCMIALLRPDAKIAVAQNSANLSTDQDASMMSTENFETAVVLCRFDSFGQRENLGAGGGRLVKKGHYPREGRWSLVQKGKIVKRH
jgi:hypothetical protein